MISGGEIPQQHLGRFLNFGGTNIYKSKQLEQIGEMFCAGSIKNGDYFLYTDAWNHSYPNYVIWQNYWVLTFALVACGMLVVMIHTIFWDD